MSTQSTMVAATMKRADQNASFSLDELSCRSDDTTVLVRNGFSAWYNLADGNNKENKSNNNNNDPNDGDDGLDIPGDVRATSAALINVIPAGDLEFVAANIRFYRGGNHKYFMLFRNTATNNAPLPRELSDFPVTRLTELAAGFQAIVNHRLHQTTTEDAREDDQVASDISFSASGGFVANADGNSLFGQAPPPRARPVVPNTDNNQGGSLLPNTTTTNNQGGGEAGDDHNGATTPVASSRALSVVAVAASVGVVALVLHRRRKN